MTKQEYEEKKAYINDRYHGNTKEVQLRKLNAEYNGSLAKGIFSSIGNFLTSGKRAREEREREERERQERIRREEERRRRIKIFTIIIIIAVLGISGFSILKNVLRKSNAVAEKTTDIVEVIEGELLQDESLAGEDVENSINEVITVDSANTQPVDEGSNPTINDSFANRLFINITDILLSANLLYFIGHSLPRLWLYLGGIFLIVSLIRTIIAIFNRNYWRKAGNSFLSSLMVFVSVVVQYIAFWELFERSVSEELFSNVLTITYFALLVFFNITIIVFLCAKYRKANWRTALKMLITAIVIYIPVIILIGRY